MLDVYATIALLRIWDHFCLYAIVQDQANLSSTMCRAHWYTSLRDERVVIEVGIGKASVGLGFKGLDSSGGYGSRVGAKKALECERRA